MIGFPIVGRIEPLDRPATPGRLHALADAGVLPRERLFTALALAGASPGDAAWRALVRTALLVLGTALALSGVIFFFAFNWALLGRLTKLLLVASGVVSFALTALWVGVERPVGKAALTAAAAMVGVVLAVHGQVYQTGADSHALFAAWAILISPWALGAGFSPLFVACVTLLQIAIGLYWGARIDVDVPRTWMALELAGVSLTAWTATQTLGKTVSWLGARALARWFAFSAFVPLTLAACSVFVADERTAGGVIALAMTVALIAFFVLRFRGRDLFALALAAAATIALVTSGIGRALLPRSDRGGAPVFLLLGLVLVGEVAAAAAWLRREARAHGTQS